MDSEFLHDSVLIDQKLLTSDVGDDPVAHYHLGHVLVRTHDHHLVDVFHPAHRGSRQGVIGFEFVIAPDHDPYRLERILRQRKLGQQLLVDPLRGLVAVEHLIAE